MDKDPLRMQPTRKSRILATSHPIQMIVNPLRFLVDAFVNTFGITQPTPEDEAKAGRYIGIMLVGVVLLLGAVAWVLRTLLTR